MTKIIERNATLPIFKSDTAPPAQTRLLDRVRDRIRVLHYSRSTEKTYIHWIIDFLRKSGMRHPQEMGSAEVESYLSYLATARDVAAGTQNQAMHAIPTLPEQKPLGAKRRKPSSSALKYHFLQKRI